MAGRAYSSAFHNGNDLRPLPAWFPAITCATPKAKSSWTIWRNWPEVRAGLSVNRYTRWYEAAKHWADLLAENRNRNRARSVGPLRE